MNLFNEWARIAAQRSNNELRLRFYPGGVMGDERDMVRKIRIHQIDGAALTTVGLGIIYRPVLVLETPGLFETYAEIDAVRGRLREEFDRGFEHEGFVFLGWGDTGIARPFSNIPVRTLADLRRTRLWAWSDHPIATILATSARLNGVRLGLPEVLPALQTGMIDSLISPPLAALQLQWFSRLRYMTDLRVTFGLGATMVSKERFDRLTPALRQILRDSAREVHERLVRQIRSDDEAALGILRRRGITVVDVPEAARREWTTLISESRGQLAGPVYPRELLERVERMLAETRAAR